MEGTVRAFRKVWPDRARTAARELDRRREHLALAGVPIGLKATEGATSQQARSLLAAGAIPIGTTATPGPGTTWQTWGLTDRGPTLNPWNHELVPGGSSAGSAVAVATSMVPLATGSDGAGSIRIPAAWCGVLGLNLSGGDGDGVRAENDRRLSRTFEATDLIATPTTPNRPHGHDGPGEVLSVALTWAFNVSGHPALGLPAGFAAPGSPTGLQLVARPGE